MARRKINRYRYDGTVEKVSSECNRNRLRREFIITTKP